MKRSLSSFSGVQKGLLVLILSNSANYSGIIIPRKKQLGKEKMTFGKITLTYLLANSNLEGEIHLKGVRFVTSQISSNENSYHCIHIIIACLSCTKIFKPKPYLKPYLNPTLYIIYGAWFYF